MEIVIPMWVLWCVVVPVAMLLLVLLLAGLVAMYLVWRLFNKPFFG